MLNHRLSALDALLDEANEVWLSIPSWRRRDWSLLQRRAWIFHELQLEGVALVPEDIERALSGEVGTDWCDGVLLDRIRRCAELLATVHDQGRDQAPLTEDTLSCWQMALEPSSEPSSLRGNEGPTEHYKHDVLSKDEVPSAFRGLLEEVSSRSELDHPVTLASFFVFRLMRIWPWSSWSGLVARLGASVLLIGGGFPPLIIPAGERVNFYQAMHYDPTRMDELVVRCLREQLEAMRSFAHVPISGPSR